MKSMEKDRQTKIMENDLRILKFAAMGIVPIAVLTLITPFIYPSEHLWVPVFIEGIFIIQIGLVSRRAISSLHKRVTELENRCADPQSDTPSQPK